jgi:hypothetical protein
MENFNFWVPLTLMKGGVGTSNPEPGLYLEGIASTADKDADGEYLDPKGFDLSYFMQGGIVNWHHQAAKDPDAIIGEPVEARITKGGLYVKVRLYEEDPLAIKVFNKARQMEANSKTRRMGFSIEGQATERDPDNEAIVTKAMITGLAITHMPKNSNTFATVCKALATGDGDALIKEDLDPELKVTAGETKEEKWARRHKNMAERKGLAKAVAMELIFSTVGDITVSSAENIYRLAQNIATTTMAKGVNKNLIEDEVTSQDIEKAVKALALVKGKDSDEDDDDDDEDDDTDSVEKGLSVTNIGLNSAKGFAVLVKGITDIKRTQRERDANLGTLLKGMFQTVKAANERSEAAEARAEEMEAGFGLLQKSMDDLIEKLDQPVERKATVIKGREKGFEKGLNGTDLEEKDTTKTANKVNINTPAGKNMVKGFLSGLVFAKGFDQQLASDSLQFDSTGNLSKAAMAAIKTAHGVDVVAE